MNALARIAGVARSPGDPKVIATGPISLTKPDSLARALGWFSLGLGLAELLAAPRITRSLGLRGKERLIRAYGVREIAAGIGGRRYVSNCVRARQPMPAPSHHVTSQDTSVP